MKASCSLVVKACFTEEWTTGRAGGIVGSMNEATTARRSRPQPPVEPPPRRLQRLWPGAGKTNKGKVGKGVGLVGSVGPYAFTDANGGVKGYHVVN